MFTDKVMIQIKAGKGGNGVVAWRREKYIPKGGPYGGNGGKGGSVFVEATDDVSSLESFRHCRILKAEDGGSGGTNQRQGKEGKDLVLKVPCGTLVKDMQTKEILYDMTHPRERQLICLGGKGGKGNAYFKSSTNRAPNMFTPGRGGDERGVELELKLIADVGLVGFPNAGKSTLFSKTTDVSVKIAAYPFTTLRPNLGFIHLGASKKILLADIPGIIADAHHNRGLGLEFLRHIERTEVLVFVLDASGIDGRNPREDFKVLKKELKAYNPSLLEKPFLLVLNKVDTEEAKGHVKNFRRYYPFDPETLFELSALTGEGMTPFVECLKRKLSK